MPHCVRAGLSFGKGTGEKVLECVPHTWAALALAWELVQFGAGMSMIKDCEGGRGCRAVLQQN